MKSRLFWLSSAAYCFFAGCAVVVQPENATTNSNAAGINGTWKTVCVKEDSSADALFMKTEMQFDNGKMKISYPKYSDGSCTNLVMQGTAKVNYEIGKSRSDGAYQIDMHPFDQGIVLYSATIVSKFNLMKAYGYSDWTERVEKSLAGRNIDGTAAPSNLQSVHSIVKVSGDTLVTGDCPNNANTCDGKTAESRHNQLGSGANNIFRRHE
jgi:hypothetical protein